jgi:large repetitive protein
VYGAVVITVTVSMVVAPVANVGLMALFQARLAQAASMNHALADLGLGSEGSSKKEEGSPSLPSSFLLPPSSPALNAAGTATDLEDCRTLYPPKDKGGYDPNEDLDQDGLGNQTEWCLGTDFKKADTDADGITDTLELAGYNAVYTPTVGSPTMTHWILDPLQDDTNRDGISDGNTCFVNSQTGVFVCPDTDGDGTPDVWDDDLDNDGVLNRDDISPYSVMPYRNQIEVDITGQYSNAAVYVDVQVQPQTTAHLRYSTTWLDWPNDSKGQIQDLDNSTEDVRLIPVLEITSPVSPHSLPATVSPPSPTRIRRAIDCGRRCSRWARGVASAPSTPASPLPLKK